MENKHTFEHFLIKIKNYIPHNNGLAMIMCILKLFPLIIFTHDWNIQYSNCVSYFLSLITLSSTLHKPNDRTANYFLMIVISVITIILLIIMLIFYQRVKQFGKLTHKKIFRVICFFMYFFNFFFVQYIFMFSANIFVCPQSYDTTKEYKYISTYKDDCRTIPNIIMMVIQLPLIVYLFIISFIFLLIISEPFSYTNNIIVTQLGKVNVDLLIIPFLQAFLGLEYAIPFKTMIIVKIAVRGLYVLYFLRYIYKEPKMFFSSNLFRTLINFIYTMCFVSCLIEFGFSFDWNNDLIYLEKTTSIIFFKLLIEFLLSVIIIKSMDFYEKKCIIDICKGQICNDLPYELLNKVFFIFYKVECVFGDDLLYRIIEEFFEVFNEHKEKSKCLKIYGLKCYCLKYKGEDYIKQSDDFLAIVRNLRSNSLLSKNKILKLNFPIMYKYLEYFIHSNTTKQKGNNNHANYLLSLVLFYIIFDKNYNKSLFYLSEFMNTKFYKNSKICRFQSRLIKLQLLKDYKNNLIIEPDKNAIFQSMPLPTENSFSEMYKRYNSLTRTIRIENNLSKVLKTYFEVLNFFSDNDCTVEEITKILKKFQSSLHQANTSLIFLCNNDILKQYHLCSKLSLFYSYFYSEIPSKIQACFQNIFEYNCKMDNYSTMLINTHNNKDSWKFSLEYLSDDLCSKLGYKISELKGKEISELFPESLRKCFEFLLLKKIKMGNVQMVMKDIVIADKDKYAHLYDIIGIVIFTGECSKIFFKMFSFNFDKKDSDRGDKRKGKKEASKKNIMRNECFVFVNKNGKVITISKEFEKFFCLTLNVIKKYKINMFRDILKIENTNNKNVIKKSLIQIYENIADLNFELMQNNSNEEFSKTYKNIKSLQTKISSKNNKIIVVCQLEKKDLYKNEKEIKGFYYISFNIEIDNNSTSFTGFLGKEVSDFNPGNQNNALSHKKSIASQRGKKFELNTNINEIYSKLKQIQILSLKYLTSNFNLKSSEIFNLTKNEENELNTLSQLEEKEAAPPTSVSSSLPSATTAGLNTNSSIFNTNGNSTNQGVFSSIRFFHANSQSGYQPLKKESISENLQKRIFIQLCIWIIFSIIFIIFQSMLLIIDKSSNKKITTMNNILTNSMFIRNIIYSIISSMLRLQYIANGLQQNTTIDNNFDNSIDYHNHKLEERVIDFLNYYKQYEKNEVKLYEYNKKRILELKEQDFPYVELKAQNLTKSISISDILSQLHIRTNYIIDNEIKPFLFNISYDTIQDRELLEIESLFVLAFENYFTYFKYVWDEIDNLLIDNINTDSHEVIVLIYAINLSNGFLLFVLFIMQSFIYVKINNQIFARYYINYNYFEFFGTLLIKKANKVQEFIENSDVENFNSFKNSKISIVNTMEDHSSFKENYSRINNKMPIMIKPYKIKENFFYDSNKFGVSTKDSVYSFFENDENKITSFKPSREESPKRMHNLEKANSGKGSWNFSSIKMQGKGMSGKLKKVTDTSMTPKSIINANSLNNPNALISTTGNYTNSNSFSPIGDTAGNLNPNLMPSSHNKTKKDLLRPKYFMCNIIAFSLTSLSIVIFCLVDALLINQSMKDKIEFSIMNKVLLSFPTNTQEILLMYGITLLKNKQMFFEYQSTGYLTPFDELNYVNQGLTHDILQESLDNHFSINTYINNKISEKSNRFKNLNDYLAIINTENSCKTYIEYFYTNKDRLEFEPFTSFNETLYPQDVLITECQEIGNGINSKGHKTALDSLINTIMNYYTDFKQDEEKSEESMFKRVNDEVFSTFLVQTDLLLDKTIMNYYLALDKDYSKHKQSNTTLLNTFFIVIVLFALAVDCFYIWRFTLQFIDKNNVINEIEPCLYNTIIF